MLHAVIMAGGSGTRFWPASRRDIPKQLLTVTGDRSLLQGAADRVSPLIPPQRTWVVTNERLAVRTRDQLPEVDPQQVLLEPCARNTAPCVALAAQCLLASDPEAVMLVMPADHVIQDSAAFQRDVARAMSIIEHDPQQLVLFGVPPSYPATGFGYIERGAAQTPAGFRVNSFREKPNRDTASEYLRTGNFLWNCGIFVWKAKRILECLRASEPQIPEALAPLAAHFGQPTWTSQLREHFPAAKSISIDYAVLERTNTVTVLDATFDWDDVGGWEALTHLLPPDEQHNSVRGPFAGVQTSNCIVQTTPNHVVATLGVDNLIIVHTPDATLVARRGDDEAVRSVIQKLTELGLEGYL